MKYFLKCLCLIFLLLPTTDAKFNDEVEVVILHGSLSQLRITRVNNTDSARLFYQREPRELIWELSVQKNGPLITFIATTIGVSTPKLLVCDLEDGEGTSPLRSYYSKNKTGQSTIDKNKPILNAAIYLINTNETPLKAHRLTPDIYNDVWNLDISQNGDIIFVNTPFIKKDPFVKNGIYLIPNQELNKASPKITLLKETDTQRVDWSPNGKQIVYETADGIYLFNLETENSLKVHHGGRYPVFSPNGGKLALAYCNRGEDVAREIRVISVIPPASRWNFKLKKEHLSFNDLKWSPNGKYIVYSVSIDHRNRHFAIPFNGGPHEEILTIDPSNDITNGARRFDWAPSAYAVEPTNRLTTLRGKLKYSIQNKT